MMSQMFGFIRRCMMVGSVLCFAGQLVFVAQAAPVYQMVELNYVDLSDSAEVSAQPVKTIPLRSVASNADKPTIAVELGEVIHPKLSGLGGAFNENGGDAFMSLPDQKQKAVAEALFNPEKGSGLTLCRTAIGSSDFGLSAYSYSETPDDYTMKHFSVARDETTVIPFIKAAMAENPGLRIFASPWSPPAWMKESGIMDGGEAAPEKNVLKADPRIYEAYALYFVKYVQGYAQNGVNIERLLIQNEPDMNPKYPGCDMAPSQMSELLSNYIRPAFNKFNVDTEIWAGSFRGKRHDAEAFMKLERAKDADGIGMQYCNAQVLRTLTTEKPGLELMHTEEKCWNGQNSMKQARSRFDEVAMWINGGCENYCYWNMILNETGKSAWDWKQNSLIKIDRSTGDVTYTSDYAPITLLSRFIRPGAQSLKVSGSGKTTAIAVRHQSRVVVFLQNDAMTSESQNIELDGVKYTVELPAQSLCAVVFENK